MNLTERIESVILSNIQPPNERKIGIECESIFYDNNFQRILVNPGRAFSSSDLLNELIVLQSADNLKATYTLEPGGQLEWASSPLISLHELNNQHTRHINRISKITQRENLKQTQFSLEPIYRPSEIELIAIEKYHLMDNMFSKTGTLGRWMMRNTTSVQINLDYSSKEEAERMAYIADCLTPLVSILFANSPFWKGTNGGRENLRYNIWSNTDNSRCGHLTEHEIRKQDGLIGKYAQYIQTVPAIFIKDDNGSILPFNDTLGVWLQQLYESDKLTDDHIQIALHQIFTHVRFKNVLEIRGIDKPPPGFELAPAALWVGLLFDDKSQEEIFNIVTKWTIDERNTLNDSAFKLELNQIGPQYKTIQKWIDIIRDLAQGGLNRRSVKLNIQNENVFLDDYFQYYDKVGLIALHRQAEFEKSGKSVKEFVQEIKIK